MSNFKYNLIINNKTFIKNLIIKNKQMSYVQNQKRQKLSYNIKQPLILFLQNSKKILNNQNKTFIFLYLQVINQNFAIFNKIPQYSIKFANPQKNFSSFTQRVDIQTKSIFLQKLTQNLKNFRINIFELLIEKL